MTIESVLNPLEQIRVFSASPDQSWSCGDAVCKTLLTRKTNGIAYESHLPCTASICDHVLAVASRFSAKDRVALKEMQNIAVTLHLALYFAYQPPISLSPVVVSELADLRAGLDVDVYICDD